MPKTEGKLAELLGRMRGFAVDHEPHGWPAIQMRDITTLCNAIVALNTLNKESKNAFYFQASRLNRYQKALEELRDGLANLPNPDASIYLTEAIDALYDYANAALKG